MRLKLVALAAALALAATACGGGAGGGSNVLTDATQNTYDAGTAKIDMTILTTGARTLKIQGAGVMDFADRQGSLTLQIPSPQATGAAQVQTLYDGFVIYMKSPFFRQLLPNAKPWIKLDIKKLESSSELSFTQISQLNQSDPTEFLGYLRGATTVKKTGSEDVRGVKTTHYSARIDLSQAAEQAPDNIQKEFKAAVDRIKQTTGSDTLPVDVWVDGQGRVAKELVKLGDSSGGATITMELFDYGVDVNVKTPAASQTTDLLELLGRRVASPSPTG